VFHYPSAQPHKQFRSCNFSIYLPLHYVVREEEKANAHNPLFLEMT
jgi:hypothetical protein